MSTSLILVPTWIPDFARQVINYSNVTISPYYSLTWIVTRHLLGLGSSVEIIATFLFGAYLIYEWWRYRYATGQQMLWTTGLTLNLTFFLAVQIATTAYIVLLIPLFQLFAWLRATRGRSGTVVAAIAAGFLFVGQWAVFLTTVDGNFETAPSYIMLPVGLLLAQSALRPQLQAEHL